MGGEGVEVSPSSQLQCLQYNNNNNDNNNNNNNNNNNSYNAIPRKHSRARSAVHYQHQNPLDNQKNTSTVNAHIKYVCVRGKGGTVGGEEN